MHAEDSIQTRWSCNACPLSFESEGSCGRRVLGVNYHSESVVDGLTSRVTCCCWLIQQRQPLSFFCPPSLNILNADIDCSIMPVSVLRAPFARLSLLIRPSSTIAALSRISSNGRFFSTSPTPTLTSRIIALRIPSASWGIAQLQQQRRGMKVRSSVKKLCEGCKVR